MSKERMDKTFCPESCELLDTDSFVCYLACWHKDDKVVAPFLGYAFGKVVKVIGSNNDQRYIEGGGSIHESKIERHK